MDVIYKVYMNERESDAQFPKLKRMFKREVMEENCDNPHLSCAKWNAANDEDGVCYSIGNIK